MAHLTSKLARRNDVLVLLCVCTQENHACNNLPDSNKYCVKQYYVDAMPNVPNKTIPQNINFKYLQIHFNAANEYQ